MADDDPLASLLADLQEGGVDTSMFGATSSAAPLSLAEALVGSAYDTTSARNLTGWESVTALLPTWARDLPAEVTSNTQFDPWLGNTTTSGDEMVYRGGEEFETSSLQGVGMGAGSGDPGLPAASGGSMTPYEVTSTEDTDKVATLTQVANQPYLWSQDKVTKVMQRMRSSGINVTTFDELVSAWGGLAERAALTYGLSQGKNKVSVWDVMDMYKSEAQAAGSFTNYENGTKTTTQRTVSDVSEGEAWSALQANLQQMLGRDPGDEEIRDFAYRMNRLAAENPSITETVTRYKAGDAVSSESSTTGGFTSADMAQEAYDEAQNDPGYAEYQAASTYYNAMISALGAMGG